jgi:hypothetical protein
MDLKKKLDSIETTEIGYITAGILVVAVAAAGLQYQDVSPEKGGELISASLTLEKPDETLQESLSIPVNSTVFDAVNQTYPIDYTEYDFGYFITSIDGLQQNGSHSWLYSVNNKSANVSVDNYILENSDNITFHYSSSHSN